MYQPWLQITSSDPNESSRTRFTPCLFRFCVSYYAMRIFWKSPHRNGLNGLQQRKIHCCNKCLLRCVAQTQWFKQQQLNRCNESSHSTEKCSISDPVDVKHGRVPLLMAPVFTHVVVYFLELFALFFTSPRLLSLLGDIPGASGLLLTAQANSIWNASDIVWITTLKPFTHDYFKFLSALFSVSSWSI